MTIRDPHHDAQLLRDLIIINRRTLQELGPLPPEGLPAEPKRKPRLSRPVAHRPVEADVSQMEDEAVHPG